MTSLFIRYKATCFFFPRVLARVQRPMLVLFMPDCLFWGGRWRSGWRSGVGLGWGFGGGAIAGDGAGSVPDAGGAGVRPHLSPYYG